MRSGRALTSGHEREQPLPTGREHRRLRWLAAGPAWLVGIAGTLAAGWSATLLIGRVNGLSAPPYDLAFFQQIIWNVGTSGLWISSFHEGSFLGLHFSPILVIPAVVERLLGPDVRLLNVVHALAVGGLVVAGFLFLRAILRPSRAAAMVAAGLAIGIPVWGTTQEIIRSDFHPEAVGVGLALVAGWAGLTGRLRTMWLAAVLALLTREDVSYAVAVIGLVVAARGNHTLRRHGRTLAIVATVWAIIVFGVLMPAIRAGSATDTDSYYAWLGGGLSVLLAPVNQTAAVVAHIARPTGWLAGAGMIIALFGLPLLRPRWLVPVLPPFAAVLLSDNFFQANLRLQYGLILVVPLIVAAGFGARRALALIAPRWRRSISRRGTLHRIVGRRVPPLTSAFAGLALTLALAAPAALGAFIQGSLPPFDHGDPAFASRPDGFDRLARTTAVIPARGVIAADEGLVVTLAARPEIRRLLVRPVAPVDAYVVMDRLAWFPMQQLAGNHHAILAGLRAGTRPVLADDGRFIVWGPEPGGLTP
ncbi:MAG: DUF2079 domain-containing protein [Chloroflexi bacterium]|nr:DUF2079 domain-containing protein [Chloroflexota bacterium]